MKILPILAAILAGLSAKASAQPYTTQSVAQQFSSAMTCASVQVASSTVAGGQATAMNTAYGYRSISVQNRDSSADLFCGTSVSVSSQAAGGAFSANVGWEIGPGAPGGASTFYLVPGEILYCVNDSQTKATNATVCVGR